MKLRVQDITKKIKQVERISHVSFSAESGDSLGILAPKGHGKSILLKILRGICKPDTGRVIIRHKNRNIPIEKWKDNIGYLNWDNPLYEHMNIYNFLMFIGSLNNVPKHIKKDRVLNLIKICGLSIYKHRYIYELSKGNKQRVGLALSLINNPRMLLLDEPAIGLDPKQRQEFYNLIRQNSKGRLTIITSSRMEYIENICNKAIVLYSGKILTTGTTTELKHQVINNSVIRVKLGGAASINDIYDTFGKISYIEVIGQHNGIFNIKTNEHKRFEKELFTLCNVNKWYIKHLVSAKKTLEDVFEELQTNL